MKSLHILGWIIYTSQCKLQSKIMLPKPRLSEQRQGQRVKGKNIFPDLECEPAASLLAQDTCSYCSKVWLSEIYSGLLTHQEPLGNEEAFLDQIPFLANPFTVYLPSPTPNPKFHIFPDNLVCFAIAGHIMPCQCPLNHELLEQLGQVH